MRPLELFRFNEERQNPSIPTTDFTFKSQRALKSVGVSGIVIENAHRKTPLPIDEIIGFTFNPKNMTFTILRDTRDGYAIRQSYLAPKIRIGLAAKNESPIFAEVDRILKGL